MTNLNNDLLYKAFLKLKEFGVIFPCAVRLEYEGKMTIWSFDEKEDGQYIAVEQEQQKDE